MDGGRGFPAGWTRPSDVCYRIGQGRAEARQLSLMAPWQSARKGRKRMDDRGPIDLPFLVFVVIVSIAVLALGVVLYPHP